MSDHWLEAAAALAKQPYVVQVLRDELTDGTPIYIALNPELEGCKSQGTSVDEALANLDAARIDYICGLLEDDLPVPSPKSTATTTGSLSYATTTIIQTYSAGASFEGTSVRVVQPDSSELLYEVSLKTLD